MEGGREREREESSENREYMEKRELGTGREHGTQNRKGEQQGVCIQQSEEQTRSGSASRIA